MVIDANVVTNLPGLDDRRMDNLIALRAACQVSGPPAESRVVRPYIDEFTRWLSGSTSNSDRLIRRYVLLAVTEGRSALGTSDRDSSDVARLADEVYRKVC
ncbi:hypothetical protein MOQ72_29325 [Saccharopolyspora sp. K220]|uniref:hypothetical protein n=1 Tax=Saccharopolyspora soli TaxID=2926618 RepID=UPI001F56E0B3|nr:hypothetical protein [Saccharopolyspora soli]MCI2421544.1 hypothetical protein [Saccharopolyspora soli]